MSSSFGGSGGRVAQQGSNHLQTRGLFSLSTCTCTALLVLKKGLCPPKQAGKERERERDGSVVLAPHSETTRGTVVGLPNTGWAVTPGGGEIPPP